MLLTHIKCTFPNKRVTSTTILIALNNLIKYFALLSILKAKNAKIIVPVIISTKKCFFYWHRESESPDNIESSWGFYYLIESYIFGRTKVAINPFDCTFRAPKSDGINATAWWTKNKYRLAVSAEKLMLFFCRVLICLSHDMLYLYHIKEQ